MFKSSNTKNIIGIKSHISMDKKYAYSGVTSKVNRIAKHILTFYFLQCISPCSKNPFQ